MVQKSNEGETRAPCELCVLARKREKAARKTDGLFFRENSPDGGKAI